MLRAHDEARADSGDADLLFVPVDVDHFKSVHDRYSHGVGDRVLQRVATILAGAVRGSDLALRWGGDEFLVVSRFGDPERARATVERLRQTVERADIDPTCTVSIGYAWFSILHDEPRAVLSSSRRTGDGTRTPASSRTGASPSELWRGTCAGRGGRHSRWHLVVESDTELAPENAVTSGELVVVEQKRSESLRECSTSLPTIARISRDDARSRYEAGTLRDSISSRCRRHG